MCDLYPNHPLPCETLDPPHHSLPRATQNLSNLLTSIKHLRSLFMCDSRSTPHRCVTELHPTYLCPYVTQDLPNSPTSMRNPRLPNNLLPGMMQDLPESLTLCATQDLPYHSLGCVTKDLPPNSFPCVTQDVSNSRSNLHNSRSTLSLALIRD